ncbi:MULTISPECIES: hypothetical protein [Luteimonas]|uniref:hypothetical protein n=1 Tax=Luteimonas TaxID=83614 RepID=UPI00117D2648|nr:MULTISPECIES: hypothetical protein [Luteimonas]
MSVQSSDSTSRPPEQATRNRQADRAAKAETREPPKEQSVSQFRQMMQQARGEAGTELPGQALAGEGEGEVLLADQASRLEAAKSQQSAAEIVDGRLYRSHQDIGLSSQQAPPADAAALLQTQMALRDPGFAAQTQQATPQANPGQLMEMMERHVRQLAVSDTQNASNEGQVLLRMSDATLPGTDLLLSKSADGWVLRADSRSRESFDAIREAGPELARRFADRNLGTLTIDPHFNG